MTKDIKSDKTMPTPPNNSNPKTEAQTKSTWQTQLAKFGIGLLVAIGSLLVVTNTATNYLESNILSTSGWMKIVSPLPKDSVVADSLSRFSTDRLFDGVNVEQKIKDALPDKAQFLAVPLANQLESTTSKLAYNVASSDQFQATWIGANQLAHDRLVNYSREISPPENAEAPPEPDSQTALGIKLDGLLTTVRERLGEAGKNVVNQTIENNPNLSSARINLQIKGRRLQSYVQAIDSVDILLPALASLFIVLAIALAKRRRQVIIASSATIAALSLLQIAGLRALRPELVNRLADTTVRPAGDVIYSAFVQPFNQMATSVVVVSVIVFIIALLFGPWPWNLKNNLAEKFGLSRFAKNWSAMINQWRDKLNQILLPVQAAIGALAILWIAFGSVDSWQVMLRDIVWAVALYLLVYILATPLKKANQKK